MAEEVRVWVKTAVIEEVLYGRQRTSSARDRSLPEEGGYSGTSTVGGGPPEGTCNWGWARANRSRSGDNNPNAPVQIYINDEESEYNRQSLEIPAKLAVDGIVMDNVWENEDEEDDDDSMGGGGRAGGGPPDDLIHLTHLHEPAVVQCLRTRYHYDKIYTSTGPILLALNPFKNVKTLYSSKIRHQYVSRGERMALMGGADDEEGEEHLPPHVYKLADNTFRSMMKQFKEGGGSGRRAGASAAEKTFDQSILVSGESGAGKTVTTKFIMQYLASLSERSTGISRRHVRQGSDSTMGSESVSTTQQPKEISTEQQVLQSNPILESFGNARTIRNDNSSRFGKFIELEFTSTGHLVGASIETYLLEKVRLVQQTPGERNYHIFYELLVGMPEEHLDTFHIADLTAEDFNMTNQSGTYDRRDGVDDYDTYMDLLKAMNTMGFESSEQDDILTVTCAVLHCSNVDFNALSADESEVNKENPSLDAALDLLGVTSEDFNRALCYFSIQAGREKHTRSVSAEKAQKGVMALIKATYGALFTYIVKKVNSSITVKSDSGARGARGGARGAGSKAKIGVLDIFGFESFKKNSFEQLCINYCNEALQQQFNMFVLKNEQEEYEREGIQWSFIEFPENQDVLELIYKKGAGILNILDDQCRAPGTTDKTFATDMYKKCTGHPRFQADFRQVGSRLFGVVHYAGPVEYDTEGFVEKNRDELPKEATELLQSSSRPLVRKLADIIAAGPEGSGGGASAGAAPGRRAPPNRGGAGGGRSGGSKTTVGGQFSQQLAELRRKIDMTSPHYVRCLKPNDLLVPDNFDPVIIADQLRCAGVIEAVRVSRVGYPQRYTHSTFLKRYRILALKDLKKAARSTRRQKPVEVLVMSIARQVQEVDPSLKTNDGEEKKQDGAQEDVDLVKVGLQVGKTKVFLRAHAYEIIEQLRHVHMEQSAVRIQAIGRMFVAKKEYKLQYQSIVIIQCAVRSMICAKIVHEKRIHAASLKIQTCRRRQVCRRVYLATLCAARFLERRHRGNNARVLYHEMVRQDRAIRIQTWWRQAHWTKIYAKQKESALVLQMAWRSCVARAALKELKAKQRDLNAIGGERDALREEVQQLKRDLEKAKKAAKASDEKAKAAVANAEASMANVVDASKYKALKEEMDHVTKNLKDVEQLLSEERANSEKEVSEKSHLQKELVNTQNELEDLRETFAANTSTSRKQEKRMVDLEANLENLKSTLAELEVDKEDLEKENKKLKKKVEKLEDEVVAAEEEAATAVQSASAAAKAAAESISSDGPMVSAEELDAKDDEIYELRETIDRLQRDLDERPAMTTREDTSDRGASNEEYEQVLKEKEEILSELEATKDLHAKELIESTERLEEALKHMELLESELDDARKKMKATMAIAPSLNSSKMPSMSGMGSSNGDNADEIAYLQNEILRLEQELKDAKEQGGAAAPQAAPSPAAFNPNSPEHLIARYEELRKLSEANVEKDRELDTLRKENNELKEQITKHNLREGQEVDGDDVFDDASSLGFSDTADRPNERSRSQRFSEGDPFATYSGRKQKMKRRSSVENFNGVRMEDYEALQAVNQMLRNEVDRLTKELSETKKKAAEEKAQAEQDLEAFSEALRGVDEMRRAAEQMSRELTKHRRRKRFSRQTSGANGSNWETMSARDDVSVISGATEMIDEAQKILHRSNRHANQTQNLFTRIRGGMGLGNNSYHGHGGMGHGNGMGKVNEEQEQQR